MAKYSEILERKIYPKLADFIGDAFPEFEFIEKSNQWISGNTLHLSGSEGKHGKGKVSVSKSKPYAIGDFREGVMNVLKYLQKSTFHPRVFDFKSAVEYLASVTNIDLADCKKKDWDRKPYVPMNHPIEKPVFIPKPYFDASLKNYDNNSFVEYLVGLFGEDEASKLVQRFYIGTSKYWDGATIFWLIDEYARIGGGQVILYDNDGHTVRQIRTDGTKKRFSSWVHTAIKKNYDSAKQPFPQWLNDYSERSGNKFPCLFGLPQLAVEPIDKPIAIVESAKTAIIATQCLPQYIWLAVGSATYLKQTRLAALKQRNITLFPDNGQFAAWSKIAKNLSGFGKINVSDLLESDVVEKGADLADYLIQFDWREDSETAPEPKNLTDFIKEHIINLGQKPFVGSCFIENETTVFFTEPIAEFKSEIAEMKNNGLEVIELLTIEAAKKHFELTAAA